MAFNPIGLVTGLASAGIAAGANALGIGKNDTRAKTFAESGLYDKNAFQYGGRENAAEEAANRFKGLASSAQGRGAPRAKTVGVDYRDANYYANQGLRSRTGQGQAADMMMQRAQGLVPSIAGQQAALDMQRATAAQSSAAASARGAAGMALAGQNAANNTATMQSAISNNAQINAAQERLMAERGAYDAYSGLRQGDYQSQNQAAQQAQFQADLAARQNMYNAGLTSQRNAQNDAYSLGLYNQEAGVRQQQLMGGMQGQSLLGQSQMNATNQNVGISQFNANREYDYYKQAMGGLEDGMSASGMMSAPGGGATPPPKSDDRAKFAMSPLSGLLGGGTPAGSGGGAQASFDVLNGDGSMNVMASHKAHSDFGTRFASDPTGGMGGGGLLSDDRAKQQAYAMGKSHGRQDFIDDILAPKLGNDPSNLGDMSTMEQLAYANTVTPVAGLIDYLTSKDKGSKPAPRPAPRQMSPEEQRDYQAEAEFARQFGGEDSVRPYPGAPADPVTNQFAQGLAPIRFQYKPGQGPPGEQTGVRAQAAASQPVTASMIGKGPDGLLRIDPGMGLSTALAGVGHLAQKQQSNEAKLNSLLSVAARREGY